MLNSARYNSHPLLDYRFVAPLVEYFALPETLVAALAVKDQVKGIALLSPAGRGRWTLFLPSQMPLGTLLLDIDQGEVDSALSTLLRTLPGYALMLDIVNQDPSYPGIPIPSDQARFEQTDHGTTIKLEVTESFEDYWSGRPAKLRENIRRAFRKLTKAGITYKLKEQRQPDAIEEAVSQHGDIESGGWKGREGTAIHRDNVQGTFYTKMLQTFAADGDARVYGLYFNDQLVASQLAVSNGRILVLLKTTYDENSSSFGPGRLMQYLILEAIFAAQDAEEIEFYTNASAQDAVWTTHSRDMYHLTYYRAPWIKKGVSVFRRARQRWDDTSK
jgi:hypothetical protein